jgi:hypothetical protein
MIRESRKRKNLSNFLQIMRGNLGFKDAWRYKKNEMCSACAKVLPPGVESVEEIEAQLRHLRVRNLGERSGLGPFDSEAVQAGP